MTQRLRLARPRGARLAWRLLLASLGSATIAFAAKPKAAQTRAVEEDDDAEGEHDHPLEAADWRTAQRAFPGPAVPIGAYQTAHRSWELMQKPQILPFAVGEQARPHLGPPVGGNWTVMGPGPVDNGGGGGLGSGRTTAIVIDPTNVNTMYAGFADGGVWKSTDGGTSWKALTDSQASLAVGAIVLDPKAPNTIYVGTGEGNFAADVFYGHGVLKSTDGGTTWTQLGADTFDSLSIPKMFIDASGALYVAASQGVTGSGLGCQAVTADPARRGLYKSTDGGMHFTQIVSGKNVSDVEFDPMASPPAGVLASFKDGSYRFQESAGTGMATLTAISALPSGMGTITRTEFGRSKSNPKVIYAGVGYDTMPGTSAVFRSTDNGATWTNLNLGLNYCSDQCFYDNIVEVHPTDPDTVYLGGMTCPVGKITGGTTNAQATCISTGLHSDTHVITLDPTNPTKVWTGSDGGISLSTNAGTSWAQKNTGLATLQLYNLCVDQNDDTSVIGCLQDNGIVQPSTVGSQTWRNIHGGDGMSCANNLGDPNTANRFLVTSVQYAAVARKTATGAYQDVFNAGMDRVNFIAPLTFDLTSPLDVYVGTYRVYKSTTGGTSGSFKAVSGDLTTGAMVACGNDRMRDDVLGAIAAAGKRVYSGSFSGKIFTSPDGGTTWNDVTKPPLPVRYVSNFAIDPMNPSDVYVAFSGFSSVTPTTPGHVFHTTNAGQTWTRVDQMLDIDLPVNAIARSPAGAIYIGHDLGVAGTLDGGQTWNAMGNGLPHVAVFALEYHSKTGTLYAGTHGRSAWKLTFGPSLVASPAALNFFAKPGQTPAAQTLTVSNGDPSGSVLNFTAAPMGAWLSVNPTTGRATGGAAGMPLSVTVNTTGLGLGNYMGSITLSAPNAMPTSISVPVVLQITDSGMPPDAGRDAGASTPDASIDASGPGATTGAGGSGSVTTGAGGGSGGDNTAGTGGSGTTMGTGGASTGSGMTGSGTASGAGGTRVGGNPPGADSTGGCGCRVGRSDVSRAGFGAALLLAWAASARMRRRRRA